MGGGKKAIPEPGILIKINNTQCEVHNQVNTDWSSPWLKL
jgi:hypothetical protein